MAGLRYTIAIRYTQRFRFELAVKGEHPDYYLGVDESDISPEALEMLRAYYQTLSEAQESHFSPTCTIVWDFEPTPQQILDEVGRGHIACLTGKISHAEDDGSIEYANFREVVGRFLKGKATFAELRAALGQKVVDVVDICDHIVASGLSEDEAETIMITARELGDKFFVRPHRKENDDNA